MKDCIMLNEIPEILTQLRIYCKINLTNIPLYFSIVDIGGGEVI